MRSWGAIVYTANIALFGSYVAGFEVSRLGEQLITSTGQTAQLPPVLVHPHG